MYVSVCESVCVSVYVRILPLGQYFVRPAAVTALSSPPPHVGALVTTVSDVESEDNSTAQHHTALTYITTPHVTNNTTHHNITPITTPHSTTSHTSQHHTAQG